MVIDTPICAKVTPGTASSVAIKSVFRNQRRIFIVHLSPLVSPPVTLLRKLRETRALVQISSGMEVSDYSEVPVSLSVAPQAMLFHAKAKAVAKLRRLFLFSGQRYSLFAVSLSSAAGSCSSINAKRVPGPFPFSMLMMC